MNKKNFDVDAVIFDTVSFLKSGLENKKIFQTEVSSLPNMKNSIYETSVYIPTYIAHSLSFVKKSKECSNIIKNIMTFLLEQKDDANVWRFYGNTKENPPPDFDDICCALFSLESNQINVKTNVWELLSKNKSESGLYYTWIDDMMNKIGMYHVDGGVNTSILFYTALNSVKSKEIIDFINLQCSAKNFSEFTIYSVTDYVTTYIISRVFCDAHVIELQPAIQNIIEYVLKNQQNDGGWGNNRDTVLALASLINSGYNGDEVRDGIYHIINTQNLSNGLGLFAYFKAFTTEYFGSSYLTSAIFLEVLAKTSSLELYHEKN